MNNIMDIMDDCSWYSVFTYLHYLLNLLTAMLEIDRIRNPSTFLRIIDLTLDSCKSGMKFTYMYTILRLKSIKEIIISDTVII